MYVRALREAVANVRQAKDQSQPFGSAAKLNKGRGRHLEFLVINVDVFVRKLHSKRTLLN